MATVTQLTDAGDDRDIGINSCDTILDRPALDLNSDTESTASFISALNADDALKRACSMESESSASTAAAGGNVNKAALKTVEVLEATLKSNECPVRGAVGNRVRRWLDSNPTKAKEYNALTSNPLRAGFRMKEFVATELEEAKTIITKSETTNTIESEVGHWYPIDRNACG